MALMESPIHQPNQSPFKNAYKTKCNGCNSMLMIPLPHVHCVNCHHTWRAKRLTSPTRCPRCDFNLWQWRTKNGVQDYSNEGALV
jgi:Zn finger protein HypA/HybF involved in hydrogenase expression